MITIKSQSIDVAAKPEETYRKVLSEVGRAFEVLEKIDLMPFDKDHLFVLMKYRGE